jgi:hypothetical protein
MRSLEPLPEPGVERLVLGIPELGARFFPEGDDGGRR